MVALHPAMSINIHNLSNPKLKDKRLINLIKQQDSLMYVYNKVTLNIKTQMN